jgi:hypothetical protein
MNSLQQTKNIYQISETYNYNLISHYNTLLLLLSFSIENIIIYLTIVLSFYNLFLFLGLFIFLFCTIPFIQIFLFMRQFLLFSFFLLLFDNLNNFSISLTIRLITIRIKRNLCAWLNFLFICLLFLKKLMLYMNLVNIDIGENIFL